MPAAECGRLLCQGNGVAFLICGTGEVLADPRRILLGIADICPQVRLDGRQGDSTIPPRFDRMDRPFGHAGLRERGVHLVHRITGLAGRVHGIRYQASEACDMHLRGADVPFRTLPLPLVPARTHGGKSSRMASQGKVLSLEGPEIEPVQVVNSAPSSTEPPGSLEAWRPKLSGCHPAPAQTAAWELLHEVSRAILGVHPSLK